MGNPSASRNVLINLIYNLSVGCVCVKALLCNDKERHVFDISYTRPLFARMWHNITE
jgi:hypothetical protein